MAKVGEAEIRFTFRVSETAGRIFRSLPAVGRAFTWGGQVLIRLEGIDVPQSERVWKVRRGDVAWWDKGKLLSFWFGPPPFSPDLPYYYAGEDAEIVGHITSGDFEIAEAEEAEVIPAGPRVVGVTGRTGAGASTFAKMLSALLKAPLLSADNVAHEALETPECKKKVVSLFGEGILRGERVDRRALGRIVFKDESKLRALEGILHPEVNRRLSDKLCSMGERGFVILDNPLLFEMGHWFFCDVIVAVVADESVRARRLLSKGFSEEEVQDRIRVQKPLALELADIIVENNGSLERLRRKAEEIFRQISGGED